MILLLATPSIPIIQLYPLQLFTPKTLNSSNSCLSSFIQYKIMIFQLLTTAVIIQVIWINAKLKQNKSLSLDDPADSNLLKEHHYYPLEVSFRSTQHTHSKPHLVFLFQSEQKPKCSSLLTGLHIPWHSASSHNASFPTLVSSLLMSPHKLPCGLHADPWTCQAHSCFPTCVAVWSILSYDICMTSSLMFLLPRPKEDYCLDLAFSPNRTKDESMDAGGLEWGRVWTHPK